MVSGKRKLGKRNLRVVLYEGQGSSPLDAAFRAALVARLLVSGYGVTCTGAGGPMGGPRSVSGADESHLLLLGIFASALPESGESGDVKVLFADIANLDVEKTLEQVKSAAAHLEAYTPGQWKPWFPVIDYDRCTNCMQCLSFCLFDVYGTSKDGRIQVQNMDNCKTDCPACSRVCPEVAILFPKYSGGPINGDIVKAEDMKKESMRVDISALLGGDIYSALRTRTVAAKERFSKERDEKRALEERKRCLKKLQEGLGIPDEVLDSLPSLDSIRDKAARKMAESGE